MNTLRLTDNHKNFGRVGTIQVLPIECGSFIFIRVVRAIKIFIPLVLFIPNGREQTGFHETFSF